MQTRVLCIPPRESFEILRRLPHAGLRRIQIREDAQDAPAARRAAGKRIHVQQIVALVQRQAAPFLFKRAKAREIERPLPGVGREKLRREVGHLRGIVPQDRMQPLDCCVIARNALQSVLARPVRDVLVQP